jgi:hypothetical protein
LPLEDDTTATAVDAALAGNEVNLSTDEEGAAVMLPREGAEGEGEGDGDTMKGRLAVGWNAEAARCRTC